MSNVTQQIRIWQLMAYVNSECKMHMPLLNVISCHTSSQYLIKMRQYSSNHAQTRTHTDCRMEIALNEMEKNENEWKRWLGWRGSVKTAELEMLIRMNVVAVFETDWTIFEILFSRVFESISNVLNIRYRCCYCCNTKLLNYRLLAICVTFYPFTLVSIPAINNNQLVFATKQYTHTHIHTYNTVHFRHWLFR